jgi:hypothetical protein
MVNHNLKTKRHPLFQTPFISFQGIHKYFNNSTLEQIGKHKLSLLPNITYNATKQSNIWLELSDQIVITGRNFMFNSFKTYAYKIALNILVNWFYVLKHRIPLEKIANAMFKRKQDRYRPVSRLL